ncbi:MAG: bifunctional glutamate N-acetyltransferase/amino-acid acetyltransferase ArgJ [Acidimicrobiales bacterium]
MSSSVSPLAPASFPELPALPGVQLATMAAGLRYEGRDDLFLAVLPEDSVIVGTFTTTRCPSAPVDWCVRHIGPRARAVLVNSGNANAFTGRAGYEVAAASAATTADCLGLEPPQVMLSSTGVIGELPSQEAMCGAVPLLVERLAPSDATTWHAAANAIRTTDTFAKGASAQIGESDCSVVGIAKGSGMIAPDMATMLSYVFTDASIDRTDFQRMLQNAVNFSFNRITVDSDTSTSDTVLGLATGSGSFTFSQDTELQFFAALKTVLLDLAHQIVRDGEGATKFVEIQVDGAETSEAAQRIARSIADSPLVKTALAAEDANWGRIVMAVGKSGEAADRDALSIQIGPELVARDGEVYPGYSEARATDHLRGQDIQIFVDVGVGRGSATVWTCDLTHGYIDINAGYRS